jgi:hypothetical protein
MLVVLSACVVETTGPDPDPPAPDAEQQLRVFHSPYQDVDWSGDRRLLSQFHDHIQTRVDYIDAYDRAGYDVVPLFQYSGMPGHAAAWTQLHWPAEAWLPYGYTASLEHIERLYPNAEQAGFLHLTSPFLEAYIEQWDPSKDPVKLEYHYESTQEAIDLINAYGGFAVLAHPWSGAPEYLSLTGYHAIEIYNAFGTMTFRAGDQSVDFNDKLIEVWDQLLEDNPRIYGLAVNDWFGPQCAMEVCTQYPEGVDTGKVVLLARSASPEHVRAAFAAGAMLAVKDIGPLAYDWPRIKWIEVDPSGGVIEIAASGADVRWISHGQVVSSAARLDLRELSPAARHVRAELTNAAGSTVWVQPFVLAPIGDINGDGVIDEDDDLACIDVHSGVDTDPDHVAAAQAADGCA